MNTREVLNDRFIVFNGAGLMQTAKGVALDNADLDTRDKCTIAREEVIVRRDVRDCKDEDLIDSELVSRMSRLTLTYNEINAQILARHTAYFLGASTAPTGSPADEVQTLARTGTVSGGTFTISLTLEGRTVVTKPIAFDATTGQIQAAMTAARMLFVQPGSVVVTGDWTAGMVLTFGGNLANVNMANVVIDATLLTGSTPGISVTQTTAGAQNHHTFARSTSRAKPLVSLAIGWDDDIDRVEKYADYVVEQITPNLSLDGNLTATVQLLGPWEPDSIETAFDIPDCMNIDPLQAQDCRVSIDSVWQTTDINTLTAPLNDNVPTDRLSAFAFDGIDVQTLERGRQPAYGPVAASIFASEVDSIYQLAQNERTEDPVPVIIHFGFPGDRVTWNFPKSKVRFQTNRMGEAGEARYATVNVDAVPYKDGLNPPFNATADLDQTDQFLDTP